MTPFAHCDISAVLAWITSIDFALWPQQHRIDDQLRPAMVNDIEWHGFGSHTDDLVKELLVEFSLQLVVEFPLRYVAFNRMLSVVMPGHSIPPHVDAQQPEWITRVHVPITTNERAFMTIDGVQHSLAIGSAYLIDTRCEHAIRNDGDTPRIHFMVDVRRS